MSNTRMRYVGLLLALFVVGLPVAARGQTLGTFSWQLQPFCNIVTITVTQTAGVYSLAGFDDQCGAGQRAGVAGTAFLNPDGTVGLGLTAVAAPGGTPTHIDARISLDSLSGSWQDSIGSSGTFVLTPGAGSGGPPRPRSTTLRFLFGEQTFTGLVSFTLDLDRDTIDRSTISVHYNPANENDTAWYPAPGLGSGNDYQTRYYLFQTSANPSQYELAVRLLNPDGSGNYPTQVTWRRVRVILTRAP